MRRSAGCSSGAEWPVPAEVAEERRRFWAAGTVSESSGLCTVKRAIQSLLGDYSIVRKQARRVQSGGLTRERFPAESAGESRRDWEQRGGSRRSMKQRQRLRVDMRVSEQRRSPLSGFCSDGWAKGGAEVDERRSGDDTTRGLGRSEASSDLQRSKSKSISRGSPAAGMELEDVLGRFERGARAPDSNSVSRRPPGRPPARARARARANFPFLSRPLPPSLYTQKAPLRHVLCHSHRCREWARPDLCVPRGD